MSMLIFYPAPSLSFLADTSDQKSLNFFQLLEDLVLTRHCLLSFNLVLSVLSLSASPSRRMKKLQLTLEKRLLNNLYPRLIFCLLKCPWTAFQKATKCYSIIIVLIWHHSILLESKTKKLLQYTRLITVFLSADCLCRILAIAEKYRIYF